MPRLNDFLSVFVDPDHNPWRELWARVSTLGPWAQYPKVYEHERTYCAYCGAWAPNHEVDCPYILAEDLLRGEHK